MTLRNKLIDIALQWQESTSALSEYDAAMLVGMSENEYSEYMKDKTAVSSRPLKRDAKRELIHQ